MGLIYNSFVTALNYQQFDYIIKGVLLHKSFNHYLIARFSGVLFRIISKVSFPRLYRAAFGP